MAIDIFNEEVCNWDIREVYCNLHVISGKFNLRFYELCHEMAREKNWVIMGLNKFCSWDIYSLEGLFQGIMFWENEMQIRIKSFMRASCLVVSDSLRSHGLQPAKSVHGIFQARTLKWLVDPSSRGSSQTRDQTQVSCIAGGFFTFRVIREARSPS